jgi:hypothetical protein
MDPDYSGPTMTELEEWNRARNAPETEVPDPQLAPPAAVSVDWPLILQTVADQMISGNPESDDLADEVIGLVTDLYEEDPLRVINLESFTTPVEREFQRLIAVEVQGYQGEQVQGTPLARGSQEETPPKTKQPQC